MVNESMHSDTEAVLIAYGSNLSREHASASQAFEDVVKALLKHPMSLVKMSRLWVSLAWPDASDPPFHNAVIQVSTEMNPVDLLDVLHEVELEFGRIRAGKPNAPRTVDLDLVAYGPTVMQGPQGIILPHPRAADRGFVMGPLTDILPDWTHPVLKRRARDLFAEVTVARDAHPLPGSALFPPAPAVDA